MIPSGRRNVPSSRVRSTLATGRLLTHPVRDSLSGTDRPPSCRTQVTTRENENDGARRDEEPQEPQPPTPLGPEKEQCDQGE